MSNPQAPVLQTSDMAKLNHATGWGLPHQMNACWFLLSWFREPICRRGENDERNLKAFGARLSRCDLQLLFCCHPPPVDQTIYDCCSLHCKFVALRADRDNCVTWYRPVNCFFMKHTIVFPITKRCKQEHASVAISRHLREGPQLEQKDPHPV